MAGIRNDVRSVARPSRPLFIVGQQRSGTSILYRLVQEHPRFRPHHGLDLSESHFLAVIAGDRDLTSSPSLRAFAALDDDGWRELERDLACFERRRRVAVRAPIGLLARDVRTWARLGCGGAARTYVAHAHRGRGATRFVEKTPNHLVWVRHLAAAFPDAKLLAITRHPVTAYASSMRRAREDRSATWAALPPRRFAERWRHETRLAMQAVGSGRVDMRLERYEDLVRDPDAFQRRLFAWLDEQPLPDLPAPTDINEFAPACEARQLYGEITDLQRDWREHLSARDAADIERMLAGPMAALGYRPMADAAGQML